MFNIKNGMDIVNVEKTGCKVSHIAQCLADKTMHDAPKYSYFGTHTQRGTVVLHTKNGDFAMKFNSRDGWLYQAEIL